MDIPKIQRVETPARSAHILEESMDIGPPQVARQSGRPPYWTSQRSFISRSRFFLLPTIVGIADSVGICFVNNPAEYRPALGRELLHNRSPESVFYNTATFAKANRSCGLPTNRSCGLPINEGGFACLGTSQVGHGQTFETDQFFSSPHIIISEDELRNFACRRQWT